jgi:hypothetical protein
LVPTHPPIQCIPSALSLGVNRPGRGAVLPLPAVLSWRSVQLKDQGLYLIIIINSMDQSL